jgi:glycosyltransferase involved in cell wall biosynthesis
MKTALAIPVKNERRGLSKLVESLQRQVSESDEIIFVDGGSTDGTLELLNQCAEENPQIKVYVSEGASCGKGRNMAIQNTDSDIIVHIDGGNLPEENWLKEIRTPILNGEADYVTGNVLIMPIRKKILWMEIDLGAIYGAALYRGPHPRDAEQGAPPAGGSSVAYKREIWERAGGFPDWVSSGEDTLFVKKVMKQGLRFKFAKDAVVYWQIGPSFFHFMHRQVRYQMAKFRTPQSLRLSAGIIFVHLFLMALIAASLIFHSLWVIPGGILLTMSFRQSIKSIRTYRQRTNKNLSHYLVAILIFLFVDFTGILAKVTGTVRGLLSLQHGNEVWTKRVEEYLSP